MGNGVNKIPLVHEPGALNNMAAAATFAKVVADKHIPSSVFNTTGGFTDLYTLPTGGVSTIETIGALDLTAKDMNTFYLMECYFSYDNSLGVGGFLQAEKDSHICYLSNALGQYAGDIKAGNKYIIDNNFIKNVTFTNRSLLNDIIICLTEIIPF